MENATKALLIAAAVLVAILIISLGIAVYQMSARTVQGINLNEQEVMAFNEKFMIYEGDAQKGTQVNSMLQAVLSNNISQTEDIKKVSVILVDTTETTILDTSATSISQRFKTGASYKVTTERDATTGLITTIKVKDRSSEDKGGSK